MPEDKIAKALDISPLSSKPIELEEKNGELIPVDIQQDEIGKDYTSIQEQIRQLAQLGSEKLKELGEVASHSQHPRAYEAFTNLMKETIAAQRELLEIQKTQIDIENKKGSGPGESALNNEPGTKTVNNIVFSGSTAEMAAMVRQLSNDKSNTGSDTE